MGAVLPKRIYLNPRTAKAILCGKTYNEIKQYTVQSTSDDGLIEYISADKWGLAVETLKKCRDGKPTKEELTFVLDCLGD